MPDKLQEVMSGAPWETETDADSSGMSHRVAFLLPGSVSGIPPYWSAHRDSALRKLAFDADVLKISIVTFTSKLLSVPLTIEADDRSVSRMVKMAEEMRVSLMRNSGMMGGLRNELQKFVQDYLTQDNGAFMLVLGQGNKDGPIVGRPYGLAHMQSALCMRTSSPEYPIVYTHTDMQQYPIHHTRLVHMTKLPNPDPELNGVGFCPVSSCLESAREQKAISSYLEEKLGSKPARQILYVETGATVDQIESAVGAHHVKLSASGNDYFSKTLLLAPKMAASSLKLNKIDLAGTPDGFNRTETYLIDMSVVASAFGLDLRDLNIAFGLQGATKGDAETMDRKLKTKGLKEFTDDLAEQLTEKYCPEGLSATFDSLDDSQDEATARIHAMRATARSRDVASGLTDTRTQRMMMMRKGEITKFEFETLELSDGRTPDGDDVYSLFYSSDPMIELLLKEVTRPVRMTSENADVVLEETTDALERAYTALNAIQGEKRRWRIRLSIAALEKLRVESESLVEVAALEESLQEENPLEGTNDQAEASAQPQGNV